MEQHDERWALFEEVNVEWAMEAVARLLRHRPFSFSAAALAELDDLVSVAVECDEEGENGDDPEAPDEDQPTW